MLNKVYTRISSMSLQTPPDINSSSVPPVPLLSCSFLHTCSVYPITSLIRPTRPIPPYHASPPRPSASPPPHHPLIISTSISISIPHLPLPKSLLPRHRRTPSSRFPLHKFRFRSKHNPPSPTQPTRIPLRQRRILRKPQSHRRLCNISISVVVVYEDAELRVEYG